MNSKDPDSNIGVGGRATFWEGVFEVSSAMESSPPSNPPQNAHPGEAVLSSYAHREVRPVRERRSRRREEGAENRKSGR
ncbi:MAG: hypothetical protein DMG62_18520 [Acidobacteria bacterium]|nr:MAG: hypothetical protein DMG62_18520 [Acidobacteriota bacterium]